MGQSKWLPCKKPKKREQSSQVYLDSNFQEKLGINNDALRWRAGISNSDLEV
jgi:hypothetical protein